MCYVKESNELREKLGRLPMGANELREKLGRLPMGANVDMR